MQLSELRQYAARMGWPAPVEYIDKASGRAGGKRPAQLRLLADARLRKFDCVLVWKMDRFGRSLSELVANIQALDDSGVRFLIPSQGIDTDSKSPIGRLVMQMMAAFAEFERAIIVERVASGVAQHRADYKAGRIGKEKHTRSGKDLPAGRPRRVWSREKAIALRRSGASLRSIAAALGVPFNTIARGLKNSK